MTSIGSTAVLISDHDDRIHAGLAVIDAAVGGLALSAPDAPPDDDRLFVELDADDFFDIVSVAMALNEPAARRVALSGLINAFEQPDIDALQLSCLAIDRFCGWVERGYPDFH